ncbi:PHD finger protein rhinoceros-like [Tigriopus californicus]|uniref:PHD finger protein rhinoceros-like n=1 Tax=Tigriopus californicus TaxID=6832 RepID=UPI0027DA6520|nr:PHD finger protein rhinoceros-like [Tigriopus californicus]
MVRPRRLRWTLRPLGLALEPSSLDESLPALARAFAPAWKHGIHRSASHLSLDGAKEGGSGGAQTNGPLRPYSPVAETLFRKDLISAMKLPDNEPLTSDDYWIVTDTWKQEWEKGVQVPVKPENLPEPRVSTIDHPPHSANRFQFPRKLLCMNRSGVYTPETHQITPMALRAEQVCSYDLDDMDQRWMSAFNGERALMGSTTINELEMEKTMEELERQCFDKIHSTLKSNEEADEQDDSVICDVCRSPDSEDANEMVFCDQCNICVHQACYGITSIPSGQWHCRTCSLGIKPKCELCPNRGGAMKATKTGQKWAHVSCALWIPEVSIGCVEKMEPITKISSIPASRWNLICVLCKEKVGSCIQCSVKTCKIAYHVTCAFKRGLEMRAIIEDENAEDGVKLRSYCQKHSLNQKRRDSEDSDDDEKGKKKHLTAEERSALRREKIFKIEAEFYKQVDLKVAVRNLDLDSDIVDFIYRYWLLKRKANGNKALLVVRSEGRDLLSTNQETEREKMKKFVALRQDLERVRNLCYMVSRREKLQRSFVKLREQILAKQLALLADENCASHMSLIEMSAVLEANHGPNVYDRVFSQPEAETHTENDFEVIISRISGEIAENSAQIRRDNPYRKGASGVTGAESGESLSYKRMFSDMSASETDDVLHPSSSNLKKRKSKEKYSKSNHRLTTTNSSVTSSSAKRGSSTTSKITKKTSTTMSNSSIRKKSSSRVRSSDSSMSETDHDKLKKAGRSTTSSTTASSSTKQNSKKSSAKENKKSSKSIFSESESDTDSKSRPNPPVFRTKGAMKDFSVEGVARGRKPNNSKVSDLPKKSSIGSAKLAKKKPLVKSSSDNRMIESGLSASDDSLDDVGRTSQQEIDDVMNVLIVPERAAARKAAAKLKQDRPAGSAPLTEGEVPGADDKIEISTSNSETSAIPTGNLKSSRTKKRSSSKTAASSMDDSDVSEKEERPNDDDEDDDDDDDEGTDGKKKSFSIFDPAEVDLYGYVPQRKAAKKASAYLKESDQKTLNREDAIFEVPEPGKFPNKKSPGRPRKKDFLPPMSERLRLSDSDSDLEEPFPVRSPRGKVSRGRGPSSAPKSPRKSSGPKATSRAPKKEKALSSRAEAFLSQRESQLDDIFEQCGFATKKLKKDSDSKEQSSEATPEVGKASTNTPLTEQPNQQPTLSPPPPLTTSVATKDSSSRSSSSGSSSGSSSSSSSSEDEEKSSRVRPSEEFKSPTTKQRGNGDHLLSPSRAGDKHSPTMVQPATDNTDTVNLPESRALTPKAVSVGNRTPNSSGGGRVPATPEQIPEFAHDDPKKRPVSAASSTFSPPRSPFPSDSHSTSLRGDLKESEMDRPPPTPGAGLLFQASGRNGSAAKGKYADDFATAPSPYSRGIPSPGSPDVMDDVDDDGYDITKSPSLPSTGLPPHLKESNSSNNNSNSRSNSSRVPDVSDIVEPPRKSSIESKDSDKDSGQSSSQNEIIRENRVPPEHPDDPAFQSTEQECASAKSLSETDPTPVTLNNRQKQTDDSGFDSDEKAAQQNQQQASDQFNQQLQSPNDLHNDKTASPQVHKHLNNQEKRPVGSTPLGTLPSHQRSGSTSLANAHTSSDQRHWKQFGPEGAIQGHPHQLHGQPDPRSPGADANNWLNEMTQSAQKEALYSYMLDMQRKMSTTNAYSQNSQSQYAVIEQMKEIYGKGIDNFDLLSQLQQSYHNPQYFQYMQQHMQQMQMYGGSAEMQVIEQIIQQQGWSSQSSSAWLGQDPMSKMMAMNPQQLQQQSSQHQQHHNLQLSQATVKLGHHSSSPSISKSSTSHPQPHHHQGLQQQHQPQPQHPSAQNAHHQSMLSHHSQQHFFPSDSSSSGLHPGQYGNKVQTNSTSSHHAPSAQGATASASSTSSSSSSSVTASALPTSSQSRHNNESQPTPQVVVAATTTTTPTTTAAQQQQHNHQQQVQRKKDSPPPSRSQKHVNSRAGPMDVPSATPVDSLPGYPGSKKDGKSLENQEAFCISKDLLDSVAAVSKLPVWKPDSERDSEISSPPQKTPDHNRMSSASVSGEKAPELIRRSSSDRDRSFESLVKRVESSPSQKEPPLRTRLLDISKFSNSTGAPSQGLNSFTPTTPAYSETRESQQSMSDYDYDDTKGGVDYDDFEGEDDDYRPCAKSRGKAQTPSTAGVASGARRSRGRGRPRGSASSRGKGRGRTKMKTVSIDSEALEKVHKTVAGTDYDFENEFEDDFGDRKEPDLSLQALREQTKRQNAILDAQKIDDHSSGVNEYGFSEFDNIIPSSKTSKKSARETKVPVARERGRGRGRGRGRPRKTTELQPSPTASDDIPDHEPTDDEFAEEEPAPLPHPKLPKLKIGALLIKRESPKGSPKPSKSSKSSKKKSQAEKLVAKVPKLKIKLGPKPEPSTVVSYNSDHLKDEPKPSVKTKPSADDSGQDTLAAMAAELEASAPPIKSQSNVTVKSDTNSFSDRTNFDGEDSLKTDPDLKKHNEKIESNVVVKSKEVKPTLSSSTKNNVPPVSVVTTSPKKGSRIDSLADRLLGASKSSSADLGNGDKKLRDGVPASDLDTIFGPPVPLDMSTSSESKKPSESLTTSVTVGFGTSTSTSSVVTKQPSIVNEQLSELDLLKKELDSQMAASRSSTTSDDVPRVVHGPKKKALNAAGYKKHEDNSSSSSNDHRSQHLKMKFKVQSGAERVANTPDPVSIPIASAGDTNAQSNFSSASSYNPKPMMRKKVLLNHYYGKEIYPEIPNGPVPQPPAVQEEHQPAVRNIIKMPKAVASVTSVPTRADYQPQLEANLERKRKRDKGLESSNKSNDRDNDKGKGDKGGKKKRGRGSKQHTDDDYKPKSVKVETGKAQNEDGKEKARKTRGKPPKKCLAESPPHDEDSGDLKAANMKYAEQIMASFDADEPSKGKKEAAKRGRKRKKKDEPGLGGGGPTGTKTPRLVIKFSKDGSKEGTPAPNSPLDAHDDLNKRNGGGLSAFDFEDDPLMVDGNVEMESLDAPRSSSAKIPKIKIKL